MNVHRTPAIIGALLLAAPLVTYGALAGAASPTGVAHRNLPVCAAPLAGFASCDAIVNVSLDASGQVVPNVTPSGYAPADLQSAYALAAASAAQGTGQTIGIVDAYNDPNVESDLAIYRTQFGLGPCTSQSGCLTVVNQSGGTTLPRDDGGWAQEISLDVDMASAICPRCKILLVEASSPSMVNLGAAVDEAVTLGATVVSNSWGGRASRSDSNYDTHFDHPGVAITASSGDNGYGAQYPAASPYVTGVGGTTLVTSSGARGWAETAWSGAGSGCSKYDAQPTWQAGISNITSVCDNRAIADVSATADPSHGVAIYDSFRYRGMSGWMVFGGTSVSSPIIASIYALAGNASSLTNGPLPYTLGNSSNLNDVTSGSNGHCRTLLCTATTGWDGPTGLGTPAGTGAF
jgi:subtilase family serine protease